MNTFANSAELFADRPIAPFFGASPPSDSPLIMSLSSAFAVFFVVSFLITIALAFYYSFTALYLETAIHVKPENVGPLMSIGQWMEIGFMLALPFTLKTFGMKNVLIIE